MSRRAGWADRGRVRTVHTYMTTNVDDITSLYVLSLYDIYVMTLS